MSKEEQINPDEVKLGKYTLHINRKLTWKQAEILTDELDFLERYRKNPDPKLMLEMGRRSQKWVRSVLETCLLDWDEKILDDKEIADMATINKLSADIYWACMTNISFLEVASLTSSVMEALKTSHQKNSEQSKATNSVKHSATLQNN